MSRIISAQYSVRPGFTPTISYVLRDDKIKRVQEIAADIFPYFYVRKSDFETVKNICQQKLPLFNDGIVSTQSEPETRLYDTTELAIKMSITNPRNVAKIRDILKDRGIKLYEADIPFVRRYAYDKGIYSYVDLSSNYPVPISGGDVPRVCWADIETKDDDSAADLRNSVVRSVSICDNENNEWFICEDSEAATINKFIATIWEYDVVCFWNGDEFDVPVLKFRAKDNKISVDWSRWRFFDTGYFYSRANQSERWNLDHVANKVLKKKKVVRTQLIEEMFRNNREKLKEYNLHDARLLRDIDNALQIFQTRKEMADIAGIFVDELLPSTFVDSIIIRESIKRPNRIVFGSRRRKQDLTEEEAEKFIGAAVMKPTPGHFKNVIELDFNALYTSIIRSLNISSETIGHGTIEGIGYISLVCNQTPENQNPAADVVIFLSNIENIIYSTDVDPNEIRIFVRAKDYRKVLAEITKFTETLPFKVTTKTSEPSFFSATNYGLFPEVLDKLIATRNEYKKLAQEFEKKEGKESLAFKRYDTIQGVYKIAGNSFHPNTQVFTTDGPIPISKVKEGDQVYSINPSTKQVELKKVLHKWSKEYNGDLLNFYGHNNTFLKITPEHHLVLTKQHLRDTIIQTMWKNLGVGRYEFPLTTPKDGNKQTRFYFSDYLDNVQLYYKPPHAKRGTRKNYFTPRRINYKDINIRLRPEQGWWYPIKKQDIDVRIKEGSVIATYPHGQAIYEGKNISTILKLIGWYLSEGHLYKSKRKEYDTATRGESKIVGFTNTDKDNQKEIMTLLTELGLNYSFDGTKQITLGCGVLYDFFEQYCGKGSKNKQIPDFMWDLDYNHLFDIFHTMYKGDGTTDRGQYNTISKRLANDVVRLCLTLGMRPTLRTEFLPTGNLIYRVGIIGSPLTFEKNKRVKQEKYIGTIFECEVEDNHNLLVGENGIFVFCGNSFYGSMGSKYGRYYTRPLGESVSVFGQYLAMRAKNEIEKNGYKVLYGDTDSLFVRGPENATKEELEKIATILVEKVNSVSNKVLEEHGVLGRWRKVSIKLEALLKNIVWFDAKKRYAYETFDRPDKIESVGIETKRSDWSALSKDVLFETIRKLFKGEARDSIIEYLIKTRDELINGKHNEKLVITKTVRRNLASYEKEDLHVKAARLLSPRDRLLNSRVNYVVNKMDKKEPQVVPVTNGVPEISQDALKFYYWNRQIFPPTERLLKVIGIESTEQYAFEEPKFARGKSLAENQSKLDRWK